MTDDVDTLAAWIRAMDMTIGAGAALRDVLRLLALPYAEHEDYREEWKPE